MRWMLLLGVTACGLEKPPAVCEDMCLAGTLLYGACLEDWGLDWTAAGYADAQAHRDSCEVWAWEQAQFEAHARSQGIQSAEGWLADSCASGLDEFESPEATCSAYSEFPWTETPGEGVK